MQRQNHEPELIGLHELALLINMDKRKLSTYIRRGVIQLPEPYQILAATTLWRKQDILEWMR